MDTLKQSLARAGHCEIRVDPGKLTLDVEQIGELSGFEPGTLPEPCRRSIEDELRHWGGYQGIRGGFLVSEDIEIMPGNGTFFFDKKKFTPGREIAEFLQGAEKLALFVCTAGETVSQRISKLSRSGDLLGAYYADLTGSLVAEQAMDLLHRMLVEEMKQQGCAVSNRYSPGYGEWALKGQFGLFALLPSGFCGIRLTPDGLMIPVKTVSGVIAIGRNVTFRKYRCHTCQDTDCRYRDKKHLRAMKFTC